MAHLALAGSEPPPHSGARRIVRLPSARRVNVSIHLRRRSHARPLAVPGSGRRHATSEEFESRHGAHHADVAGIVAFAREHRLQVRSVEHATRIVTVSGSARTLERAFSVELLHVGAGDRAFHSHEGPVHVPAEISEAIQAVVGLSTRPAGRPHLRPLAATRDRRRSSTPPELAAFTIQEIVDLYDFPRSMSGRGQRIGILEFGGGIRRRDLESFFRSLGRPMPSIPVVSIHGVRPRPSRYQRKTWPFVSLTDAEVLLDVQVAAVGAPGADLVLYFAPNTERGYVDLLKTAVHDRLHRPSVLSISWGGPERNWTKRSRDLFDETLREAAHLGISVCLSAGDDGAFPEGPHPAVEVPASCPHALACGGTRLEAAGGRIVRERVWNDLDDRFGATGGGVSVTFARPRYQADWDVPAAPGGHRGRGVPDVAGVADPETGYRIRAAGRWVRLGGTSAVAPLWASLIARLNEGVGRRLGFLHPVLYRLRRRRGMFGAVTSGSNGLWSAGPGWNPCTGLGTPRGTRLLAAVRRAARRA